MRPELGERFAELHRVVETLALDRALPADRLGPRLTQLGVIVHYLGLSFWPSPLVLDYTWKLPQTVLDVLSQRMEEAGSNYLMCQLVFGDMTLAEALHSIALFANKVMPELKASVAANARVTA